MHGLETIKKALARVQPETPDVEVGAEVRVGKDSTDDDAVWVYVVVPDDRIDTFYGEWERVREDIESQIREGLGNPDLFVYVRMRARSEVAPESPTPT